MTTDPGRDSRARRWPIALAAFLGVVAGFLISIVPGVHNLGQPARPTPKTAACWHQTGDPGHVLGVASGGGLDAWSEPKLYSWMAGIKHAGSNWERNDLDAGIQTEPGHFSWHGPDFVQSEVTAAGICHPLLILDGDVGSVQSYARFAAAAARHFPHVMYWQLGNEINYGGDYFYHHGQATPAVYVKYLAAAAKAIKAVNPKAFIVCGAMAPAESANGNLSPADFMQKLYEAGGKPYFDAAAVHPYSWPVLPSFKAPWNSWQQMFLVRHVMVVNGDSGTKIWITEFGSSTHGTSPHAAPLGNVAAQMGQDHVTPQMQRAIFNEAVAAWAKLPWTGPMFYYSWQDKSDSHSSHEGSFGVLDFSGNPKPVYAPFVAAARRYG